MNASRRGQTRLVWAVLLLLVLPLLVGTLLVGWVAASWLHRPPAPRPVISDTPTLLRQVQGLNELTTVKYVLEKVVLLQDVKWYGENRLLMVAHGVARAGVNLNSLASADVRINGTRIHLVLPKATITDVFLDDRRTQVIERTTGLLREFDKDLEQDARRQAVDQLRAAARDAGMLRDADERARHQIGVLLRGLGFTEVEVTTVPK